MAGICYRSGVHRIFLLLHLVAGAAALLFLVLGLIYVVLAAWMLWEREMITCGMLFGIGGGIGWAAVRALIGLRNSFIRRRRRYQAERDLPWATVVSR